MTFCAKSHDKNAVTCILKLKKSHMLSLDDFVTHNKKTDIDIVTFRSSSGSKQDCWIRDLGWF